jgi:ribosomal-protein-alanine N-acetyltransferase
VKTPKLPHGFSLKTKRLIVRFYQMKDYAAWREAYLNLGPKANRWDEGPRDPKKLTRARFKKMVAGAKERRQRDQYYDFIGFDKKTGKIIGLAALMDVNRGVFHNAYLGYRIFNNYWGKGYAAEITAAAIDVGFRRLKLHRVEAGIEPGNKRSTALAKKLKLRFESLSKRRLYLRNKWQDMLCYALTSEERGYKHPGGQQIKNRR